VPQRRKTGIIYVVLSGVFFGFIGYFGMTVLHAQLSVNALLFWRFLVSTLFMAGVLMVQRTGYAFPPKCVFKSIASGALLYGPSSALYFVAAQAIGSGVAMVLFFTFPAMVMLLNKIFFKHDVGKMYYVAIAIMLTGLLFLMHDHGQAVKLNLFGIEVSLLSALLFAVYITVNHSNALPATVDTLFVCLGSTLSAFVFATLSSALSIPQSAGIWVNVLGIGIVCTAVPILLLLKGLKNIGSLEASILSVFEPVFVVIFGVLLLGEVINFNQLLGIIILLSGALFALLTAS
jgi:drug/metabolite transporter (DMT)-like permease